MRASLALLALFACTLLAPAAGAQPAPDSLLDRSFVLKAGTFLLSTDLEARLDGQIGRNEVVDFRRTFGLDGDFNRFRADAVWRINPRHHLRFFYFDSNESSSRTLDRTVNWGELQFQLGARVDVKTELTVAQLAYDYALWRSPDLEVAAGLGVHYMDLSLRLAGTAQIVGADGSIGAAQAAVKESSLPAPLPVVGLRGTWRASRQLYLDAQAQFFKVSLSGYDGRLTDLRFGATWMFTPNWGAGLAYDSFVTKVDVERDTFNGNLRLGYSGLLVYLTGAF
jgi:hypothetical protein